jgi:hypothetical protein
MVVSMIIAIILSFCMAATAIFYDRLDFTIELFIRNWGTAFLTIMLITMIFPSKAWGDKLAGAIGAKPYTLLFGLISNIVPTIFYNTGATCVLVGVNVTFSAPFYWMAVAHDYLVMFAVSYVLSLIAEAMAIKVAIKSGVPIPHASVIK